VIGPVPVLVLAIAVLVGYFLPVLSALLTRQSWAARYPEIPGLLTTLTAVVTGYVTELIRAALTDDVSFHWQAAALAALGAWFTATQARARVWAGSATDRKALRSGLK
jgi:hypothetical protein